MAPLPSRGGSFAVEAGHEEMRKRERATREVAKESRDAGSEGSSCLQRAFGIKTPEPDQRIATPTSVEEEIRYLNKHYHDIARQPSVVRCDMQLTPPIARAYCPQQQRDVNPIPYYMAYAADVPLDVVQQSRVLSGFDQLSKFHEHRKDRFVLSFMDSPDSHHPPPLGGRGVGGRGREGGERRGDGEVVESGLIEGHLTHH